MSIMDSQIKKIKNETFMQRVAPKTGRACRIENGELRMESGEWKIKNPRLSAPSASSAFKQQLKMKNGEWRMKENNSQFSMNWKACIMLFCILLFGVNTTFAVPAYPEPITYTQPNGETLTVTLKGDEFVKWAVSEDGYTLLYNKDGYFCYAVKDGNGDMVVSQHVAKSKSLRNSDETDFLQSQQKGIFYSETQLDMLRQIRKMREEDMQNQRAFPTTGQRKLICVLMQYPDKPFVRTKQEFQNLFNQVGFNLDNANGSIKDYFLEASYNQFDLTVDVVGPFTASHNLTWYGDYGYYGDMGYGARALLREGCTMAYNAGTDFSHYDNDKDGTVDGIYMIFAGYGQEAGSTYAIWSHAWNLGTPLLKFNGVTLFSYSCSPELRSTSGTNITYIGVICHEFGHTLGAPDYYDTDYATGGQYQGTGNWDLQAGGSWNDGGRTPPHPNPRSKIYTYGWATVTELNEPQIVQIPPSSDFSNAFYRINTTTSGEYFLIENRQKKKFDAYAPGHGLVIYRSHAQIGSYLSNNTVNATHPQRFYPVAANATAQIPTSTSSSYGTINSTSCPFPGTLNKTEFSDNTTPSMKSWASANTNKPITDIVEDATTGIITFNFMNGSSFSIQASATAGGTISPSGNITVEPNGSKTFTFAPYSGYKIQDVKIDNVSNPTVASLGTYTFNNVNENHSIQAIFTVGNPPITITATTSAGGTISPSGTAICTEGNSYTYTFSANVAHEIENVLIDNVPNPQAAATGVYTFNNVTESHKIHVNFIEVFVPVVNIANVPTSVVAGMNLTLNGVVEPPYATHKDIIWSVKSQGGTGATINGNVFNAPNVGTATITGRVTGGLVEKGRAPSQQNNGRTADYEQEFLIAVTQPTCAGTGTEEDPYQICTAAQLFQLAYDVSNGGGGDATQGKHYMLMYDIDLVDYASGQGWLPIGGNPAANQFQGNFNGNGKVVKNLFINKTGTAGNYQGLFGFTNGATIKNLGVDNCNITGTSIIGGLIGHTNGSTIIENCYTTGFITSTTTGDSHTGGLIGHVYTGDVIKNCYSSCTVTSAGNSVGGLVGRSYWGAMTIQNCYANGNVKGTNHVGGLIGYASNAKVQNCFTTNLFITSTNGTSIGRIGAYSGTYNNNYALYDMIVTSNGNIVEITSGLNTNSGDSNSLSSFTDFEFYKNEQNWYNNTAWSITAGTDGSKMWKIFDNMTLPFLQWQKDNTFNNIVFVSAGIGGTVTPSGYIYVPSGGDQTITITPNANFEVDSVKINGIYTPFSGGDLHLKNITETKVIKVSFKIEGFDVGNGTFDCPYEINNAETLALLATFVNNGNGNATVGKYFILTKDIDLSEYLADGQPGNNSGAGWNPIGNNSTDNVNFRFCGTFEGKGHKITGLWINRFGTNFIGLFGFAYRATIKNLGVEIAESGVNGRYRVGGLVGLVENYSIISNCYVIGNVTGNNTSGVYGGGFAGAFNVYCTISNCYFIGNVTGLGTGSDDYIGGFVGTNFANSKIENCFAIANVTGNRRNVGGFAGQLDNYSTIENCYATGNVKGNDRVGGLVGFQTNNNSTIRNCIVANSSIISNGTNINRILGYGSGTLQNNYALEDMIVTANGSPVTITPNLNGNSGESKPLSTFQTFTFYNFATNWYNYLAWSINLGIDESKAWSICADNTGLPYLQWQKDISCPQINVIAASAGANGTISPNGAVQVNYGENQTFTITANTGYQVASIIVDGVSTSSKGGENTSPGEKERGDLVVADSGTLSNYPSFEGGRGEVYTFNNVITAHTIAVSFEPKVCFISASVNGGHGTISPAGNVIVQEGTSRTFTFTPNEGYEVASILVDGVEQLGIKNYELGIKREENSLASLANPLRTCGESEEVNLTANNAKLTQRAQNSYTFENVTENHTIVVTFAIKTYTITASVDGGNGAITPNGVQTVNHGDNITFEFEAVVNYHCALVLVDGINYYESAQSGDYSFTNITENHSIVVSFAINTYIISASVGEGEGEITPAGNVSVNHGASQLFKIISAEGYRITSISVDGIEKPEAVTSGSYEFTNVTEPHTIVASFALKTYTITASVNGGNGSITPSGEQTVNHGESLLFTITPVEGYQIMSVLVDGEEQLGTKNYELGIKRTQRAQGFFEFLFENVTTNHTIVASFAIKSYEVTVAPNNNAWGSATISGTGTFVHGATATITATANTGYEFVNWSVIGGSVISTHAIDEIVITDNMNLLATFKAEGTYNVFINLLPVSAAGLVSGAGDYAINQNVTVEAIPNEAYNFINWTDYTNGNVITSSPVHSFTITKDMILNANFEIKKYTIASSVTGANGTINPVGNITVNHGDNQTFTITPAENCKITSILVDGVEQLGTKNYELGIKLTQRGQDFFEFVFENVTANHTIVVKFAKNTYSVNVASNPVSGGTAIVSGNGIFEHGTNATLTATPVAGYEFLYWTSTIGQFDENPLTFEVNENVTFTANFKQEGKLNVAIIFNEIAGTVTGAGEYNAGQQVTVIATTKAGFKFSSWTKDEIVMSTNSSYSFVINENMVLRANFEVGSGITTYIISASVASGSGSITPSGNIVVEEGTSQTFTITPNSGHRILSVLVDGEEQLGTKNYELGIKRTQRGQDFFEFVFENVTANHTIVAAFEPIPTYMVTFIVKNSQTDESINDAVIVFDGSLLTGYVAENVLPGSHPFTVKHEDYEDESDAAIVENANITVTVKMTKKGGINGELGIRNYELRVYPNPTRGELRIENGELRIENGEWRIENGELRIEKFGRTTSRRMYVMP